MAVDPRKYLIADCGTADAPAQKLIDNTTKKRGFFDALGKIGDLEILNNVFGGSVGKGLRSLASISDVVRTGLSVIPGKLGETVGIPSAIASAADAVLQGVNDTAILGAGWVMDTMGIPESMRTSLSTFDPNVVNRAQGQATVIYDKIKAGNFKLTDIPQFAADFINLERLARGIFKDTTAVEEIPVCEATQYVRGLTGSNQPKFGFLFFVEIQLNPEVAAQPLQGSEGKTIASVAGMYVKTASRPNITYLYDDVNYYNYRTKVQQRVQYDPVELTFYDDQDEGWVHAFYELYLKATSPISRMEFNNFNNVEDMGMNWGSSGPQWAASLNALSGNQKNIIQYINLYHVMNWGRNVTRYHFINPKITTFKPSDLDMATSEPTDITMSFEYDTVNVEVQSLDPKQNSSLAVDEKTNLAGYPIRFSGSTREVNSGTNSDPGEGDSFLDSALGAAKGAINTVKTAANAASSGVEIFKLPRPPPIIPVRKHPPF